MPFSGYHFLEHRSISNDDFPTPTTAANSDDNLIKDDKKSDNLLKKYPTHQNSFQQYLRKKLRPKNI